MRTERKIFLLNLEIMIFVVFNASASLYVTDVQMNKMIELTIRKPHCRIIIDRGSIQQIVLSMDSLKIRQVPIETIHTLEKVCIEGNQLSSEIQGGLSFIYPGTLWCGPGNIAKNYSDLGRHSEEDKCCRAHDNCYPQIAPGECLKSICNKGSFTRLHCDCDEKFRRCLSSLNTDIGNTLGAAFFNTVQVTCFDYRRPCSIHQRSECDLEIYRERPFQFNHQKVYNRRSSEDLITAEARIATPRSKDSNNYSLQLLLQALYENFVHKPFRVASNFAFVTKTIFYAPSTKINDNVLIAK
ncbi:phospholipase A2 hemilipin-like [Chironomus tepperi]|uniref:phospholipase A2 hemilipin-like n=1 Tax=Chironomus tepperi TaxID=113505 RepID=UPI00391F7DA7